jgi:hypothetical protein
MTDHTVAAQEGIQLAANHLGEATQAFLKDPSPASEARLRRAVTIYQHATTGMSTWSLAETVLESGKREPEFLGSVLRHSQLR